MPSINAIANVIFGVPVAMSAFGDKAEIAKSRLAYIMWMVVVDTFCH